MEIEYPVLSRTTNTDSDVITGEGEEYLTYQEPVNRLYPEVVLGLFAIAVIALAVAGFLIHN